MKIAWLSPFSSNSAIAKYTQIILQELSKYCEVNLFFPTCETPLETNLPQFILSKDNLFHYDWQLYELVIFNMGNYLPFHKEIYEVCKSVKGIVILHDFVMHHFFASYYLDSGKSSNYIGDIDLFYGNEAREKAILSLEGKGEPLWESNDITQYPLFERCVLRAEGVITHSSYHLDKVEQWFCGPVAKINHPFYLNPPDVNQPLEVATTSNEFLEKSSDQLLLLTIGNINPNKQIDWIIKVLGIHQGKLPPFLYVVIGSYPQSYFDKLQQLISNFNLKEKVVLLGYQPENILHAYLRKADICINLRYPAIEGASWSLVEQMSFGKAIIANDTGCYSEIPDDCIKKLPLPNQESDLLEILTFLMSQNAERRMLGERAKRYIKENFTAKKYVEDFLKFSYEVLATRPKFGLADRIASEFKLMGISSQEMKIFDTVSQEISLFFPTD